MAEIDAAIRVPCNILISGPSQSGKTTFVKSLLLNRNLMFSSPFTKMTWCYGEYQPVYEELQRVIPGLTFVEGLPKDLHESFQPSECNLVVLDDLMDQCNNQVTQLFTRGSHHRNLTVIFLVQNLFFKSKECRTISLNTHYMVLFKNPRDMSQVHHLAHQMYPGKSKFLKEVYEECTRAPHGYLFVDFRQETPEKHRLRTGILPEQQQYVYLPK
jgi:hypothetical protein